MEIKKEYTVEYEFEINKDTKIVYNNEDSLQIN